MNSNVEDYRSSVNVAATQALTSGQASLSELLPCLVCRELEAPDNSFVSGSDPFMVSYRALRRMQHISRPSIPRKIEFGSAVYLKEGIIDCIFPDGPVALIFVGDGISDKRFAYNSFRLFGTFSKTLSTHCFICNPQLIGSMFGDRKVSGGWDEGQLYYHANSWDELNVLTTLMKDRYADHRILLIIDLDGTLLCPRPMHNEQIKSARKKAIVSLSDSLFDDSFFDSNSEENVSNLVSDYGLASNTGFSKAYDDEDLTMLIALGLYAGIISYGDPLLHPQHNVGFVNPIEWLQYVTFVIGNDATNDRRLRHLRSLYVRSMDSIQAGSPTAFVDFRKAEEKALVEAAAAGAVTLNRSLIEFIANASQLGAIPIGFSDRPNASLGFITTSKPAITMQAGDDSLFHTPLILV